MTAPIIRAADIGYGYTKYTTAANQHSIQCSQFPSVVPRASKSALSAAMGAKRDTVVVRIGNEEFEVGPGAEQAQSGLGFDRVMGADFSTSKNYLALTTGALYYMGVDKVDMLVLGLPVNTWQQHRGGLEENYRKSLVSIGNRQITLESVKVVPQPFGSYAFLANSCSIPEGVENVLVIDPGFGTLDWLVVSDGVINDNRCGAAAGRGMSTVLAAVKREIEHQHPGCEVGNIQKLDQAIRSNRAFRLYGEEIPISRFQQTIDAVTAHAVATLSNMLGSTSDIDLIAIAGGPAKIYEKAVRERFSKNRGTVLPDPGYANVRGFQMIGQQLMANHLA